MTAGSLAGAAREGDRAALARLLSVVESGGEEARAAVAAVHGASRGAAIVGITGAPGAGKSTLTDRLIGCARADADRVAVLAVDPTSPFSGGAILGDRVRMQSHGTDPGVFIRSMATRGHLGGLAAATPLALRVLDATGWDWILVETVGVGQVEIEVAGAADTTVVVVTPGWGDGVQASKAGLLEVGDVFVVNKADRPGVEGTVRDLEAMLALAGARRWQPPVVPTVAVDGSGVQDLWDAIGAHRRHLVASGELEQRRDARVRAELRALVLDRLRADAARRCQGEAFDELVARVASGALDPFAAATEVVAAASASGVEPSR